MKQWIKWFGLAVAIITVSFVISCTKSPEKSAVKASYTDEELGLRHGAMEGSVKALPGAQYSKTAPGESKKYKRGFYDAPPMIPHDMESADQSLEGNDCLDCHEDGDEETPGIPPSHRVEADVKIVDQAHAKGGQVSYVQGFKQVEDGFSQFRFNCTQCHAPQADNLQPLVHNSFESSNPKDGKKDALDSLNDIRYE